MNIRAMCQLARTQVGAHYLWGGRGELPGRGTLSPLEGRNVRIAPNDFSPDKPCICTAEHPAFGARCAGRWGRLSGGPIDTSGAKRQEYLKYLEDQRSMPPERVGSGNGGLTPRRVVGGQYTDAPLVWGERCDQSRHFDCVGLINWLISIARGTSLVWEISHYPVRCGQIGYRLVTSSFDPGQHPLGAGDIACLGNEHIGIVVGQGEMVESMDARNGVVLSRVPDRIKGWSLISPV